MKKSIYFSGIACAQLMLFGSLFKIQHWPGAGVLLTLSTFLFCFFFLPAALASAYREQEEKKFKATYAVTFLVFAVCMMGVLFKVQHWPGASVFLLVGIPLPFVLFLPVYLYETRNEKKNGNLNFSGIMFGLIFLAVFSVLLSLNVSKNVLDQIASGISRYGDSASLLQSESRNSKGENSVTKSSDDLCAFIEDTKCEILTAAGNNLCENNHLRPDFHSSQITNHDNSETTKEILFGDGVNGKINTLKIKMNTFRESLLSSGKISPELTELVNSLFDVSTKTWGDPADPYSVKWESREFPGDQAVVVLDVLSQIQSNVRLAESEYLAMN